ncbi:MAG: hypothetical protein IPG32_02145 [Saprospirales bacterium]|nr:hypothetical protein [Saprospirales bacterium]
MRSLFSFRALAIVLIAFTFFRINDIHKKWRREALLSYDAAIYYAYLPAVFIYKDLGPEIHGHPAALHEGALQGDL